MFSDTIPEGLRRDRLERRIRQAELVISALSERAAYRRAVMGTKPLPLVRAIEGFEIEVTAMRRRLDELHELDRREYGGSPRRGRAVRPAQG